MVNIMLEKLLLNIRKELYSVVEKLGYVDGTIIKGVEDIFLELPKDKDHGDYATNLAMKLTKVAKKRPLDIANEIVQNSNLETMHLAKMEIAGPGFINLFLDLDYLHGIIFQINSEGSNYGNLTIGSGENINLEYVSANPTGYLHVGHGRGAAYGDSLSRIMKKAGYKVNREHYVNDAGNQITNMALSVYERYKELYGEEAVMKDDYYHGKEIIEIANMIKEEYQDYYITNTGKLQ